MSEYSLSNAELSILSLIAERPRHGYELEQVIEERGMRNWTEVAFSSIYYILKELMKKGLAISNPEPAAGRGPARKVFSVTPSGCEALRDGIRQALTATEQDNQRFLLGLSCLPLLTSTEVQQAIQERTNFLADKIHELSAHPALTLPGFPPHLRAMFEYSLALLKTELEWSEEFLASYLKGK